MKRILRTAFASVIHSLPERAAYAALHHLCDRYGISSVVARSKNGALFEGSLDDLGLFTLLLRYGSYAESSPNEALEAFFNKHASGTYIDIGANIGTTTIPFALRNPKWHFYAFEPDPGNFGMLQRNLNRNGVDGRAHVFNVALADKAGRMALRRSPENFGDYRLDLGRSSDAQSWDSITVTVETLDTILATAPLATPILIKIDVQGAEPFVYRGGPRVLSRADMVALEFWPKVMADMGNDPVAFFQEASAGFASVVGLWDGTSHERSAIRPHIERILSAQSLDFFDIILSH
jgi:FkbM family methyltransferase